MSEQYISPLLSRLQDEEELTLENLAHFVPQVHDGKTAQETLNETPPSDKTEYRQLQRTIRKGERAKEELVLRALPLIKMLAGREFRRRQAWSSRVSFEDLVSEGLAGFIKGLYAYNPQGTHRSPTNYLGQWITTEMKRNVEELDHDFSVPYEAIERQRKIRAIRSRLLSELGRNPTDQEIIDDAAKNTHYGDSMMGRVNKAEAVTTGKRRRVITQRHIDEERDMARRTGAVLPSEQLMNDGVDTYSTLDSYSATSITEHQNDTKPTEQLTDPTTIEDFEAQQSRQQLANLIETAFTHIKVGTTQQDIIRRRFGLPPYEKEQKLREISQDTDVPKHRVSRILSLFNTEMSTPGGTFHKLIFQLGEDEAHALGMHWILTSLGDYTHPNPKPPHKDLIGPVIVGGEEVIIQIPTTTANGILAAYQCPQDKHVFTMLHKNETATPTVARCPNCHTTSPRIR